MQLHEQHLVTAVPIRTRWLLVVFVFLVVYVQLTVLCILHDVVVVVCDFVIIIVIILIISARFFLVVDNVGITGFFLLVVIWCLFHLL